MANLVFGRLCFKGFFWAASPPAPVPVLRRICMLVVRLLRVGTRNGTTALAPIALASHRSRTGR